MANDETVEGTVESARILGQEFWGRAVVSTEDGTRVRVIGSMLGVEPGESVKCWGFYSVHPSFGEQFKARRIEAVRARTPNGTIAWLTKRLPRIGMKRAQLMVDHFGVDGVWDVLAQEPERLAEIEGVQPKDIEAIRTAYQAHQANRSRDVALRDLGLTEKQAASAVSVYGGEVVDVVRANPYKLIEDVRGIGFLRADKIARTVGLAFDSPHRIRAGVGQSLADAAHAGHTYVPMGKLCAVAAKLLGLDADDVRAELLAMRKEGVLYGQVGRAQLRRLQIAERSIAGAIQHLAGSRKVAA